MPAARCPTSDIYFSPSFSFIFHISIVKDLECIISSGWILCYIASPSFYTANSRIEHRRIMNLFGPLDRHRHSHSFRWKSIHSFIQHIYWSIKSAINVNRTAINSIRAADDFHAFVTYMSFFFFSDIYLTYIFWRHWQRRRIQIHVYKHRTRRLMRFVASLQRTFINRIIRLLETVLKLTTWKLFIRYGFGLNLPSTARVPWKPRRNWCAYKRQIVDL